MTQLLPGGGPAGFGGPAEAEEGSKSNKLPVAEEEDAGTEGEVSGEGPPAALRCTALAAAGGAPRVGMAPPAPPADPAGGGAMKPTFPAAPRPTVEENQVVLRYLNSHFPTNSGASK